MLAIATAAARRLPTPIALMRRLQVELGVGNLPQSFLESRYAKPESRFLNVDGVRVHYTDEGQGPVLVLLHGVMASLHTWDGWVDELRAHYRIVRVDLPGFGLSSRLPGHHYHPDYAIPFLERVREALDITGFHLAGNSMGGLMSWLYAVRYPQHVNKLVLLDPVGYEQPLPAVMDLVSTPIIGNIGRLIAPRALVTQNIREVYGDVRRIQPGVTTRYHQLLLKPGNRETMVNVFRLFRGMHKGAPFMREMKGLKHETLLIWGAKDRWVPPAHIQRWQADVPHIQVKVYPDAGHVPMEEIPELSARDAHAFLQGSLQ